MNIKLIILTIVGVLLVATSAYAQIIPGPADVGRVRPTEEAPALGHDKNKRLMIRSVIQPEAAPRDAKTVKFFLKGVRIQGMTVFKADDLQDIYSEVGREVTLDIAWEIANKITQQYHDAGFFLSRAYVPLQNIKDGIINLSVIEGYIGKVKLSNELAQNHVVQGLVDIVESYRPVTAEQVEGFLLRVNDLPGLSFRAVLSPMEKHTDENGGVLLTLIATPKSDRGLLQFDNFGSRFLGPHQLYVNYYTSFIPLHQTSISGLTSIPTHKLKYGALTHTIVIAPDIALEFNAGVTAAFPGHNLKVFDIDSHSTFVGLALEYQLKRSRRENLAFTLCVDGRDTKINLLDTPFVRDRVRAARAELAYDYLDDWNAYNQAILVLSQGLKIFDASRAGDSNLSRLKAKPDFTKLMLSLLRRQSLGPDWSTFIAATGQIASISLYSSEEFGYGGQGFGRAYDSSEITGDHGANASVELRYDGWQAWQSTKLTPYAFYDVGAVWNYNADQSRHKYGASAGLGIRFSFPYNIYSNIGLAFPIARKISTPIYSTKRHGPRILLQLTKEF